MEQLRPTADTVYLKDCEYFPPPQGAKVIALNKSGVLCFATVNREFIVHFDAWMEYPRVPHSVKTKQSKVKS